MELVDREKACQEILATRKYIEGPPENTQDNWVLQYLKERLHKDMNSAYEIWKEIFESNCEWEMGEYSGDFNTKWENLKDVNINPVKNHKIYFREIELINSCQLKTIWQKEALLVLVLLFKFSGRKTLGNLEIGSCLKYIKDAPKESTPIMSGETMDEALRVGLFCRKDKQQWDSNEGNYSSCQVYEFEDRKQKNDIVCFEIWNAYDVSKYSGWFDTNIICQKCGKKFVSNCKTKRLICDNCWREKERERKRIVQRKWRGRRISECDDSIKKCHKK